MEKRFSYSRGVLQEISKRFNIRLITDIVAIVFVAVLMFSSETFKEFVEDAWELFAGKLLALFFVVVFILDARHLIKLNTIRNNISQCWLEVDDKTVFGATSNTLDVTGSVHNFQIAISDIRRVNLLTTNIPRRKCQTLQIEHKTGLVDIPVEKAWEVKKLLEESMKITG